MTSMLLSVLLIATQVIAPASEPPFTLASRAFFAVSVKDLGEAKKWYGDKLGLSVTQEMPATNGVAMAVMSGGGLTVELLQRADARSPAQLTPAVTSADQLLGVFKVGIVVTNFDATVRALGARGVTPAYGPYPARNGQPANAIFKDMAGNLIQIFGQ